MRPPSEVKRDDIENPDYWRRLNPAGKITRDPWRCSSLIGFSASEIRDFRSTLREEGYFQTRPCIPIEQLERLTTCAARVMEHGHAPAYALLYDDFFEALAGLSTLLSGVLGPDFKIVPDEPDVYFIPTANENGGAEPHRDTLRSHRQYDDEGLPSVLNLWVALTDATTLNSCIHVIPAHSDPDYRTPRSDRISPTHIEVERLQTLRALPVEAGSVLGWSTELMHWGGSSSARADLPRLSFAMYFQRGAVSSVHPVAMKVPFSIDFDYRLYLIEKVWRDPPGEELAGFIDSR